MAIAVTCHGCKRSMKVKDAFAGQRALCPFCKAEVQVPDQEPPGGARANEYALVPDERDDRDYRDDRDDRDDEPRRRPRLHSDDEDVRKKPSGGGVLSGILMMVGALVWFFGALALNWIAFYPPILFIVGFITFIKGLSSREE